MLPSQTAVPRHLNAHYLSVSDMRAELEHHLREVGKKGRSFAIVHQRRPVALLTKIFGDVAPDREITEREAKSQFRNLVTEVETTGKVIRITLPGLPSVDLKPVPPS